MGSKETAPESKLQQGRPDSLSTLGDLLAAEVKKQGKLETMRIPLNQFPAPSNASFEAMVKLLKGTGSAVPVILSDQGGKNRAATGAVVAALIKEAQALMLGEFPVVMDLVGSVEAAKEAKQQVDRIIDAVGVENIRENVVMDKMQFDVAGDEWRELLKERIMDQIEKYFMLIVFALYCKEAGPDGFSQTFSSWLSGTPYQDQIATGKGKLEWERKIPDDKISALKDLMNVEKFDENLPEVINQINQLSYKTFNDLPRGDQKCKSMRKLAGRTLIDILPPKLTVYLEDKFGDLN